ncbi:MAG TPA: hypothetical protein VF498_12570 [Anaerolineales bacterium]
MLRINLWQEKRKVTPRRQSAQPAPYHINPRFRAFGKARIDLAKRIKTQQDWDQLWKEPANSFPFSFSWKTGWRQCFEYRVDDFAAEAGFLIDFIGLPVQAFGPDYAMLTSPGGDFYFGVAATPAGEASTPPDSIRIQFMVTAIEETVQELERRGVAFAQRPQPCEADPSLQAATFRTPHGICVDLWGEVDPAQPGKSAEKPANIDEEPF